MPFSFRKFFGLGVKPQTATSADTKGELEVIDSTGALQYHNGTSVSPVVTAAHAATLTNKTIDADSNTITNIENADIKAAAAIDATKIADGSVSNTEFQFINTVTSNVQTQLNNKLSGTLTDSHIFVGNGSNVATDVAVSGDVTITNTGDVQIATGAIVNADINASAAIDATKIADGSVDNTEFQRLGAVTSAIVGITDTQTLTNKTIDGDDNTVQDLALTSLKTNLTDANKFLVRDGSGIVISNTKDVPTGVVVGTTDTQTLTNKTLTSPTINTPTTDVVNWDDQGSTPSNPSAGFYKTYFKTDGKLYKLNSSGVETEIGSGGSVYIGTAGENLATNDAVYICRTATDAGRTVGSIYKLDATSANRDTYLGIVVSGVSAAASVTIQVVGEMLGFTGLNQGDPVYASVTVPGSFQLTAPAAVDGTTIILGWGGTASTKLIINGAMSSTNTNAVQLVSIAGFTLGGGTGALDPTDVILKLSFGVDTISTLAAVLSVPLDYAAGQSSSTKGYAAGGYDGANGVTTIRALTFSNETAASLVAVLPAARNGSSSHQSSTAGYTVQGEQNGGGTTNSVYKLTFSGETVSTVGTAAQSKQYASGVSSSTDGYSAGGLGGGVSTATINKLTFGTDTSAANANSLTAARQRSAGAQSSTKGYILTGTNDIAAVNSIEAITFSNDTVATLVATTTTAVSFPASVSSNLRGYVLGGTADVGGRQDDIQYLIFSNETAATSANVLPAARSQMATGVQY